MTAYPNVSDDMQFRLGAVGNFLIIASHSKEICLNFAVPAKMPVGALKPVAN